MMGEMTRARRERTGRLCSRASRRCRSQRPITGGEKRENAPVVDCSISDDARSRPIRHSLLDDVPEESDSGITPVTGRRDVSETRLEGRKNEEGGSEDTRSRGI